MAIDNGQKLRIWQRDSWHCRYCLEPVFFAPTLKLLGDLSPGHSHYQSHGAQHSMLPLLGNGWAMTTPREASETDEDVDYLTACWSCIGKKRGNPSLEVKEVSAEIEGLNWDGMSSVYPELPGGNGSWSRLITAT